MTRALAVLRHLKMNQEKRLIVADGERVTGIVTLADLMAGFGPMLELRGETDA